MNRTLVFVPTYNERDTVGTLVEQLMALQASFDVLFCDDGSPDGTGKLLQSLASQFTNLQVIERAGKLGIGSAHKLGIRYAYERGYDTLITMDCDGTHPPQHIPEFLASPATVAVGSRYMIKDSLSEWTWMRRLMTRGGHLLTTQLLRMPYDASSAYRRYALPRIPQKIFERVQADGYGFFFESLYALHVNGISIDEVGIRLPARSGGRSKMSPREAAKGISRLFELWWQVTRSRKRYVIGD